MRLGVSQSTSSLKQLLQSRGRMKAFLSLNSPTIPTTRLGNLAPGKASNHL